MSGIEIAIPVVAAVFALISAFKDGGAIAEKLKERRQRRGVQPPSERLQRVFEQGAQEIESSKSEGVEDFGDEYLKDQATASKIKDITIVLQDSIIKDLIAAFHNDDLNDFAPAIDSVVQVRKEAVNILNDHYLNLRRRRSQRLSSPQPQASMSTSPNLGTMRTRTNTLDTTVSDPRSSIRTDIYYSQRSGSMTSNMGTEPGLQTPQSPQAKPKSGKWGGIFNRKSPTDTTVMTTSPTRSPPPQMQSPPLSNIIPAEERQTRPSQPTWNLPSPAIRRLSTAHSTLEPLASARDAIIISEDNNYAGLCKCAFHAQKFRLSKAMETSMRNYEWMYHCKKCKYSLHADPSKQGNPHFDDRIQVSVSGMKFRCLFLWKSHIPTKDKKRQYACLLCLFTGRKSNIHEGEDNLFNHIIKHTGEPVVESSVRHAVRSTNTLLLNGPIEIHSDGVLLADAESFDLEFPQDTNINVNNSMESSPRPFSFPMLPESALGDDRSTGTQPQNQQGVYLSPTMSPRHEFQGEYTGNMRLGYGNTWLPDTRARYAELDASQTRAQTQSWPLP